MKIFVSYPHQPAEHADIAERVAARLRAEEGIDEVWMDRDHLLSGKDWPQEIVDGILTSDCTIGFLSRYAVREPGVCLNELSLSSWSRGGTGLIPIELERLDELPLSVSHVQTLSWYDTPPEGRLEGPLFETRYAALLSIIRASGDGRRRAELDTIQAVLGPSSDYFDHRIRRYVRDFVGRDWLFDAVDDWSRTATLSPRHRQFFVLVGGPGIGKTAWASNLVVRSRSRIVGFYFVERGVERATLADRMARTFIRQMAYAVADFRRVLLRRLGLDAASGSPGPDALLKAREHLATLTPSQLLRQFFVEVAAQSISRQSKLVLVIDGLDEASTYDSATATWDVRSLKAILGVLNDLPPWLGVVITSRPEPHLDQFFKSHGAVAIGTDDRRNVVDLGRWVAKQTIISSQPDATELAERLAQRASGNFRFAELAVRALALQPISRAAIDRLPSTLNEMYAVMFHAQFPDVKQYRSGVVAALGEAVVSPIPLPLAWLARWQGWSPTEQRHFLEQVGSLMELVELPNIGPSLQPFHGTVKEWIESPAAGTFMLDIAAVRAELAMRLTINPYL